MGTPAQDVLERFVDRYAHALEREGIPLIAARIAACFLIEDGPFTLDGLAASLEVSRGSASTSTRMLESMGIIERTSVPGDRRTHYRLSDHPYDCWLRAELDRLQVRRQIVVETLQAVTGRPLVRDRLEAMLVFQELVIRNKERALDQWRAMDDAAVGAVKPV